MAEGLKENGYVGVLRKNINSQNPVYGKEMWLRCCAAHSHPKAGQTGTCTHLIVHRKADRAVECVIEAVALEGAHQEAVAGAKQVRG